MAVMASALITVSAFASPRSGMSPPTILMHFGVIHGSVKTNGPYTLVMSGGGAGQVIDEITGQRVHLRLPGYCHSPAADPVLGDSWLMEECNASHLALYSLARRRWRRVTVASGCVHFNAGPGSACVPLAVGKDWIELDEESDRFGDVSVFQNIQTGRVRRDPTKGRTFPSLDSPSLARRLCRPLQVPSHTFVSFAFQGPFILVTDEAGPVLERCATRLHRDLRGALQAGLGPGAVMWLSSPRPGPIDGIFLPSLKRFRVMPPHGATDLSFIQLSSRHLYLSGSTRSNLSVTWSALLPTVGGA
jgi:hypothetical protein